MTVTGGDEQAMSFSELGLGLRPGAEPPGKPIGFLEEFVRVGSGLRARWYTDADRDCNGQESSHGTYSFVLPKRGCSLTATRLESKLRWRQSTM